VVPLNCSKGNCFAKEEKTVLCSHTKKMVVAGGTEICLFCRISYGNLLEAIVAFISKGRARMTFRKITV
jgi:hypothetical protein